MTPYLDKLRCLTHTLNLVTKSILNENGFIKIQDIVKKCRSLVCTFKQSNFLSDRLKKVMKINRNMAQSLQIRENESDKAVELPSVQKLKQDVPTRWNSTYIMLQSVFEAQDSVKSVIYSNNEIKKNIRIYFD